MATEAYVHRCSDKFMVAASRVFVAPADDTYFIISIPQFALVTDVWLNITTAYVDGTPSISVGFAGNKQTAVTTYFITNDIAEPTVAGLKVSVQDTLTSNRGKYFNAGPGSITMTVAANSATTEGTFQIFAQYALIS